MVNTVFKEISKDLSVDKLLQSMKEIKKMKQILFSKEEETLFNFHKKPIIHINDEKLGISVQRHELQDQILKL